MSRFLTRIAARAVGGAPVLSPRPVSVYEPDPFADVPLATAPPAAMPPADPVPRAESQQSERGPEAPGPAPAAPVMPGSPRAPAYAARVEPSASGLADRAATPPAPVAPDAPAPVAAAFAPPTSAPAPSIPRARRIDTTSPPTMPPAGDAPAIGRARPAPARGSAVSPAKPMQAPAGLPLPPAATRVDVAPLIPERSTPETPPSTPRRHVHLTAERVPARQTDRFEAPSIVPKPQATAPESSDRGHTSQRFETPATVVPPAPPPLAAATPRGAVSAPKAAELPVVDIRIGRIDVRAPAPSRQAPGSPVRPGPSLEGFLGRRE